MRPAVLPPPPMAGPAAVRRLRLEVGRRLDGLVQGDHLGHLPGPGTEPAEARAYAPGDEVRRLDWAVTARSTEPHVRMSVADRELETTLVVDLSASMSCGSAGAEKRDVAVALAAAFLNLGDRPGDRVGALLVTGTGVRSLPLRGGRVASTATLRTLLATPRADGAGPGVGDALASLSRRPRRRGLTVVLSDLSDDMATWQRPLRVLGARHDVVVVQVVDRRELALPDVGVLHLVDPETGQVEQVRTSARTRERYAAAAAARAQEQRRAVLAAGASHGVVRTDQDWLPQLARFLAVRRRVRCPARRCAVTFTSPERLWLLAAVGALAVAYVLLQRRRSRYAVRLPGLALLASVAPRLGWRKYIASAALLLSMVGATAAFAEPRAQVQVPPERATLVVALDVSPSMAATDVDPDRLTAAKAAAVEFVEGLPAGFDVGLVAFAGTTSVAVAPTQDRTAVTAAVQDLTMANGTAIGEAVASSLSAVAGTQTGAEDVPAHVVLLSDGANTVG
jgi:uncharacterized protein (DUF58 family)